MSHNSFGRLLRITTWGESHGKGIGVVIDGCPSNIELNEDELTEAVKKRSPGRSSFVSPRAEPDYVEIVSGVFEGRTTGAPVALFIHNIDVDSRSYEHLREVFRPGHAAFTYYKKYGNYDFRGGGRASARETVARVAAGAVAKKLLSKVGLSVCGYLYAIGSSSLETQLPFSIIQENSSKSAIFCPDPCLEKKMIHLLESSIENGNSLGGQVGCIAKGVPIGLGDPVYEKLEARLAFAMMSLPASRAFEVGSGVHSCTDTGLEHNDAARLEGSQVEFNTNNCGGILAGISTGQEIRIRVTFKPTSSIRHPQKTVTRAGEEIIYTLPPTARHDPCVAIRAVPVVEAMMALVLADAYLIQSAYHNFTVNE